MSLFVFNNQQKLIKSIPNLDLISVVQDQAINVSDTLFVEMPADIWSNLKEPASYLAVQDPYERFSYHMYKVSKYTTKADTTDIEAVQIGYDELKAYGYIKDRRFNNRPVLEAATAIVDGTNWQLGYVDANLPNVNTNFYYISRLEALSKLIEATGAEVRFRIEISGNKIIAKRIDLYKQLGTFKGKRFAYGSNLLEIIKEEDTSELYTALVGRGKGEETDTGGFGRRITFADIAWSKASGEPVDKPLGQEFIELPEMTAYYGYPDGEPRTGIVEFSDIEEPEQLLKATYERLVEISRPQVQFKAKIQTTGDMQLGEEVAIIRSDLGFRYKTRVFRVKRDYLNNMFTEVELGDKLTETLASRIKKIDITNARREETIIQYIQTAANGKNKIFRGPIEPTEGMMVNDLWYKPNGIYEIMYQWDGTIWKEILNTADLDRISREVNEAIAEIEGVKTDIDGRLLLVNQEIANNFTSLSTSIENVNNIATQAQLDAIGALGIVNNVNVTVNQLNGEIDTLITRVDGNDVLINQVKSTADGTVQTLANHAGRLTTVETNVNGLQTTVANKAEQSQVTQLSNAYEVTVSQIASWSGVYKVRTANPMRLVDLTGNDLDRQRSYDIVLGVKGTGSVTNFTASLLSQNTSWVLVIHNSNGSISNHPYIYLDSNGYPFVSLYAHSSFYDVVATITEMGSRNSSLLSILSDNINLRVTKGDVVSQINIEAGRTLISSSKLLLDANTVTFSGSAFIPSAAISSLSADKVTTGTLNAANVNIINLNVSSVVGLNSTFVQSAWNSATGGNVQATGNGVEATRTSDGTRTRLSSGTVEFWNTTNNKTGSIGVGYNATDSSVTGVAVDLEYGKEFSVRRKVAAGSTTFSEIFGINWNQSQFSVRLNMSLHDNDLLAVGRLELNRGLGMGNTRISQVPGIDFHSGTNVTGVLHAINNSNIGLFSSGYLALGVGNNIAGTTEIMRLNASNVQHYQSSYFNKNAIWGVSQMSFENSGATIGNIANVTGSNDLGLYSAGALYLGVNGSGNYASNIKIQRTVVTFSVGLNMGGNAITNQSDKRLKTDITPTNIVALDAYRQLNMVDYSWIDTNKPSGRHLGVIAQDTPFWSMYDAETDTWMINSSKQIMYNSLGIKELTAITDKHTSDILRIDTFVSQHEQEIINLKQEIDSLKQEVEYLKSA